MAACMQLKLDNKKKNNELKITIIPSPFYQQLNYIK
jgi:hypothetical protein